jgi:predicted metallo-beta-lactamase superfamily hydrolase
LTLRFKPLCSESLGVRSFCVYVETADLRILLDAGVSLGQRFNVVPHPLEYKALRDARAKIRTYAEKADVITISHYHFDHYTAAWTEFDSKWTWSHRAEAEKVYGGKIVYAKDYRSRINYSQRKRGYIFGRIASDFTEDIIYADSQTYSTGNTEITFSAPLPHGEEGSSLGYILVVEIRSGGKTLAFYPDVQGPTAERSLHRILETKPDILIIGGPPIYLSGWRINEKIIEQGLSNLATIAENIPLILIDHHILRNEDGLARITELAKISQKHNHEIRTFAEHLGLSNRLLEARRRQLFEEFPPTPEFQKWMTLPHLRQISMPPPL